MDLDADAFYRALCARDPRLDGRVFVGVKSTGVYCRPICPARTPKRENVTFHLSAAAAQEAGFRPCLRCRPESSPDLGAWRGTSNTVSRALAMIESGALDTGGVDDLAGRLGLGERQLRRLFREHLGASPVAVAQTRRVLLAKQLLHETNLSMTQVALASGFGSVRRFNETFQQLYRRPPAAFRRDLGSRAFNVEGVSLKLAHRPPYDWEAMISFLTARAIPGVELASEHRYARTYKLGEASGIVIVEPDVCDRLRVTVHAPDLRVLPQVIRRVRRVFDLAADPEAIGNHLSADALLAPLVAVRPGLRAPGAWDGFELAVRAVLGQQVSVAAARTLGGRLAAEFGEPCGHPMSEALGLTRVFPSPERLIGQTVAEIGMPRSRGGAIAALAEATRADPRLFEAGAASLMEATARLRRLPGIGEWTAQYIALRALREPDAFPHGDLVLVKALSRLDGGKADPDRLLARSEAWRPWRAYAAQHLWSAESAKGEDDRAAA